jgi:hypothetical protein
MIVPIDVGPLFLFKKNSCTGTVGFVLEKDQVEPVGLSPHHCTSIILCKGFGACANYFLVCSERRRIDNHDDASDAGCIKRKRGWSLFLLASYHSKVRRNVPITDAYEVQEHSSCYEDPTASSS